MSIRKLGVADLILNETVSPLLTLIVVANPWIDSSPMSSHWLGGTPGCVFSQATALTTGGVHGAAWDAAGATASATSVALNASIPVRSGRRLRSTTGLRCMRSINGPSCA